MPTYTGILGTADSQLGQIQLGALPGLPRHQSDPVWITDTALLAVASSDGSSVADAATLTIALGDGSTATEATLLALPGVDTAALTDTAAATAPRWLPGRTTPFALRGQVATHVALLGRRHPSRSLIARRDTRSYLRGTVDTVVPLAADDATRPTLPARPATSWNVFGQANRPPGWPGQPTTVLPLPGADSTALPRSATLGASRLLPGTP